MAVIDSGIDATALQLDGAVDESRSVAFGFDNQGRLQRRHGPHDDVYGLAACAGIITPWHRGPR
ncbi:MAG: hypothetical protein R2761_31175 [Acidimicrobiales bacterium]